MKYLGINSIEDSFFAISSVLKFKEGFELVELQANLLISAATGISMNAIDRNKSKILTLDEKHFIVDYIQSGAEIPVPLYLGFTEILGHRIYVNKNVLLPGTETLGLIGVIVKLIKDIKMPKLIEVGAGSGVVSILTALSNKSATVFATEISTSAVEVADCNIRHHKISNRVKLFIGNWFEPLNHLKGKLFDLVVSNPPYVKSEEIIELPKYFRKYAPSQAINGGSDGLDGHKIVISKAFRFLKSGGFLVLQTDINQAEDVREIIAQTNMYESPKLINGSSGVPQIIVAKKV